MNEQIKNLWDESWDDNTPLSIIRDKFARLIVSECIARCEKNFVGAVGTPAGAHNTAVNRCIADIKQHFGIV